MRRLLLGFVCALQVGAATAAAQVTTQVAPRLGPDPLHMAVMRYFAAGYAKDTSDFATATADLDGDGIDDAVVLVRGVSWCVYGSGCTMLVFRGTPSGFRFISKSMLAEAPILLSTVKKHGWKSLIVHAPPTADKLLTYDGRVYPITSSGLRPVTAAEVNAATLLIEPRRTTR